MVQEGPDAAGSQSRDLIRNPLWIVSLFLSLSESVAGAVTVLTSGPVQIVFAFFAVTFPLLVSGAFFYTLWSNPMAFYAPKDYNVEVHPSAFAEALARRSRQTEKVVTEAALSSVERLASYFEKDLGIDEEQRTQIVTEAREQVLSSINRNLITVNLSFVGLHHDVHIAVEPTTSVADFLNEVYFAMNGRVPPFTYGDVWLLVDDDTGQHLGGLVTDWSLGNARGRGDDRRLSVVGIVPGQRLRVVDALILARSRSD